MLVYSAAITRYQSPSMLSFVIFFVNGKIMIKVTNNQYKNGNRNENIMLFIIV